MYLLYRYREKPTKCCYLCSKRFIAAESIRMCFVRIVPFRFDGIAINWVAFLLVFCASFEKKSMAHAFIDTLSMLRYLERSHAIRLLAVDCPTYDNHVDFWLIPLSLFHCCNFNGLLLLLFFIVFRVKKLHDTVYAGVCHASYSQTEAIVRLPYIHIIFMCYTQRQPATIKSFAGLSFIRNLW